MAVIAIKTFLHVIRMVVSGRATGASAAKGSFSITVRLQRGFSLDPGNGEMAVIAINTFLHVTRMIVSGRAMIMLTPMMRRRWTLHAAIVKVA